MNHDCIVHQDTAKQLVTAPPKGRPLFPLKNAVGLHFADWECIRPVWESTTFRGSLKVRNSTEQGEKWSKTSGLAIDSSLEAIASRPYKSKYLWRR